MLQVFNNWPLHIVLFVPLLDLKFALFDNKSSLCTDVFTWLWHTGIIDYSFGPVHCPCILKLLCFGELFLSMVHVYLMEIELGQWAKSCRLVLISKSDHCQKTFELTLRYIYIYICVVSLKMFRYSWDEREYCAISFLSYLHSPCPLAALAFFSPSVPSP